ncbi:hypothetical protein B0H67DRAFT_642631 [Lasiosphaeris hirsuta]|uniref:CFEM domain-containing protein n=1 Tax=Lasiosphaeris hirsuta TaxID=260670 RepID=A0AA40ANT9_9PEZI|nr:hypothetical protein B0H67DRAFT_642631 [Lasiosphaeris hirsuta]
MKAVIVATAFAGLVQAQDVGVLPACGQICINNMLALAPSLGCPPGDTACLCGKGDFGYGVRDCAAQACGASDAGVVVAYGANICANAVPSGPAISAMGVTPNTAVATATPTDDGSSASLVSTASDSDGPLKTLVPLLVSTFTSGNTTVTTTMPDTQATAVTVVSSGPGGVDDTLTKSLAVSDASSSRLPSSASGTASGGDGTDARTSSFPSGTPASSSAAKSSLTSDAGAMPLVTVAVDGLFVGAMGAVAVLWF